MPRDTGVCKILRSDYYVMYQRDFEANTYVDHYDIVVVGEG